MEANSWSLAQGKGSTADATSGDWRTQLPHEWRLWVQDTIFDVLKKCLPISVPEGLNELRKIVVRFEEKTYAAATSEADYLTKISRTLLSVEKRIHHTPPSMLNPAVPNRNPIEPGMDLKKYIASYQCDITEDLKETH